ncbi:obscurin-like [Rhodnius prolixus]|uniref:obscurin-like n=1 Tax=Rhodnius prolixus TaxID=13249 RepID=UPI003D18A0F6
MMCHRCLLMASISWSLIVSLRGQFPNLDEDNDLLMNYTTIWELLRPQSNPYLQELSGYWSFNDTIDISKYEEFDHTRFEGSRELSLEELLAKVKEKSRSKAAQHPGYMQPTSQPDDLPMFDTNLVTNSTAQLGGTAYLHCRVRNLNNRAVSWVRRRDWHILTSAMFTYTNDERFQVLHTEGSDDWTLQIKYVQKRDNGAYECQVATGRGTLSHYFNLIVVVPTAYILGTGEYHIGQGSTINLVCIIENSPIPPQYVMWYHNDKMINYEESDENSRVQVITEPGGEKTHSRLVVTEATSHHSGNYTCRASNTEPDSVHVFVSTDGDNIAAIQRHDSSDSIKPSVIIIFFLITTFLH